MPFDSLQLFNQAIGLQEESVKEFSSVEEIYQAFHNKLEQTVDALFQQRVVSAYKQSEIGWISANPVTPCSVISLFEENCIASAKSYYDCGTTYLVRSPHIGGAPDVANSLHAIDQLVYVEKKLSLEELVMLLRGNWEGAEPLRQYVRTKYTYYGNDTEAADRWHSRLLNDFADLVRSCGSNRACPVKFIPGVSTFGRQVDWLPNRTATAFGYRKGDILAGNDSPTPGTDCAGATAMIKSHCKADLLRQSCGAALDVKILPATLSGENGVDALVGLMRGFLALGGFFLQLDAVDVQTLLDAQANPQEYKTLSVRVSGWNARFVTLNREWQNMIIERNAQGM
jgi:formate C-acetyltransferase